MKKLSLAAIICLILAFPNLSAAADPNLTLTKLEPGNNYIKLLVQDAKLVNPQQYVAFCYHTINGAESVSYKYESQSSAQNGYVWLIINGLTSGVTYNCYAAVSDQTYDAVHTFRDANYYTRQSTTLLGTTIVVTPTQPVPVTPAAPTAPAPTTPTPTTSNPTQCTGFTDISSQDERCPALTFVKEKKIFEGYPDGSFKPSNVINRAEATKVILNGFNKVTAADLSKSYGQIPFTDVSNGLWYTNYIMKAQQLGIVTGYPDKSFQPNKQVTKAEMFKIFFKTAGIAVNGQDVLYPPFYDVDTVPANYWYIGYVNYALNLGIIPGASDGAQYFFPNFGMTRGDLADLFYKYLKA